ncbi:drug/metabolite transporter (DMT)-like permease [Limibacillus sp. MBR-115]
MLAPMPQSSSTVIAARSGASSLAAIGFMVAAGFLNTIMLSAIKHLADDLHPLEVGFFRCLVGLIVLLPVIWHAGGLAVVRTERIGAHMLRGALNAAGMLTFFWAISLAPLATISAIGFTAPLFASLLAIVILAERVGLRRWIGIGVGFAGTLIILRPGADSIGLGALMALGSSVAWAGAMIVIKRLTATESPLSITAWAAFFVGLFSFIPTLFVWQWPSGAQWWMLAGIGALGSMIQFCFAKAFSLADTTVVLPFDFLKLVWASILGFLIFQEVPDLWTWVGGSVIFGGSIYIAYRERKSGIETAVTAAKSPPP